MNSQRWRRVAIGMHHVLVYQWQWLSLGVVCLFVAWTVMPTLVPSADVPPNHPAKMSAWEQAVHAVQSALKDTCADQFTVLHANAPSPEMESVVRYLRAHQVERRSSWEQVTTRVRCYLYGR